jgi:pyruvate/2-oxoglutarate dehydrogenase complex dihydrolipoamide acyltransferase (E2) component
MTALALLFAVFQARPSPFCVLDEVDAALDDANVGRFLAMLDNFREHTQFVVVTHNKGTMAACSALYGVTMEVKGVSRHVAVQFGDVDRIDPDATGNAAAAVETRAEVRARVTAEPEQEPAPSAETERVADAEAEPVVELAPARRRRRANERPAEPEPARSEPAELVESGADQIHVEPAQVEPVALAPTEPEPFAAPAMVDSASDGGAQPVRDTSGG